MKNKGQVNWETFACFFLLNTYQNYGTFVSFGGPREVNLSDRSEVLVPETHSSVLASSGKPVHIAVKTVDGSLRRKEEKKNTKQTNNIKVQHKLC